MATFSLCSHSRENNQALGDLFLCGCWLMALSLWPHLNLVTSQRSHLPILPHWGLRLQHYDFWGSTIQSIGPKQIFKIWKCFKWKLGSECRLMFLNFPTLQEMDLSSPGHFGNPGPPFLPSQVHVTAECSAFLLHVFFVCVCVCDSANSWRGRTM